MKIENQKKSLIFTDTALSDLFVSDHLPDLTGNQVKIYVYLLFLGKNKQTFTQQELAQVLEIPKPELSEAFDVFIDKQLMIKKGEAYELIDLKQNHINENYIQRTKPLTSKDSGKKDAISSINKQFFQGLMGLSWYSDVELWFSKYQFDEDVMFSLFNHCAEAGKLKKPYVSAVAKNWHEAGIKNHFDLEKHFQQHKEMQDVYHKISKKLKRRSPFTEYETKYIKQWINEYGFNLEIIDKALRLTTKINNPNLEYVHKILTTWHKKGYQKATDVDKDPVVSQDDYFKKLRAKNKKALEERKKKLYSQHPDLKQLHEEIADLSIQAVSANKAQKADLLKIINEKEALFEKILKENNYPQDYLEPIFTCLKCKDSGMLQNGKPCSCRPNR